MPFLVWILLMTVLLVAPNAAGAQMVTGDRAYGTGTYSSSVAFDFNATSDPTGGGAQGFFRFEVDGDLMVAGYVTCLRVSGSEATISGIMDEAGPGFEGNIGVPVTFTAFDGGPTGTVDRLSTLWPTYDSTDPPPCQRAVPDLPITSGDIVVEDATCMRFKEHRDPSKSKCKDK